MSRKSNAPIKSAFAPIRPPVIAPTPSSPTPSTPPAAPRPSSSPPETSAAPEAVKPKPVAPPPEPIDVELEIWLDVVSDPTKPNIGVCHVNRGYKTPVRAVIALNRNHHLVNRSLREGDTKTTTWLTALLMTESLTFHLGNPFARPLLQRWKSLLPEGGQDRYRYLYLANQLAEKSELAARIPELPIFGADPAPPTPYLLASILVEGVVPTRLWRDRRAGKQVAAEATTEIISAITKQSNSCHIDQNEP